MSEIRPLVIEKIVVKAKKLKDIKKTSHHHHHGHHSHNGSSNDESKDHSAEKVEENWRETKDCRKKGSNLERVDMK